MSDDKAKIIDKVKKCLALAKSSNEHEAATALRQAQKLMQQHGISDLDIEHADIQEEVARAGAAQKPAHWECALAGIVGDAFGCTVFLRTFCHVGNWVFVGVEPSGEIASYAFEVLFRQAKRARKNYIKSALVRCTTTRTRRADLFCEGWVLSATKLLQNITGNEATESRISAYLEHKYRLTDFTGRDRNAGRSVSDRDRGDFYAGQLDGRDAQLNRGVGGAEQQRMLEGGAA